MNATICQAIRDKNVLELPYHGYSRIVEPHAYGRDRNGDEILRCFQTAGGSDSGEGIGWKILKVNEIYSLHHANKSFAQRPEYRPNDKAMVNIFSQL